jgi:myo-inositol 2-dehydrogenase / D-chiro-inositol 1-dehydrogenase
MNTQSQSSLSFASRRKFLASSALGVGAAIVLPAFARGAHAAGGDEIKFGLIGCGARGTGAAAQALSTAGPIKLWAMADAFADRLQASLKNLTNGQKGRYDTPTHSGFGGKIDVPPERQFSGLDAYKQLLASGVDVVVMAQPPGFRPEHFEAAVAANKHVFMEKPLATDAPGVRRVLAAAAEAKTKGLKVGVGLQRRHEPQYVETIKKLRDGAIGKLLCLRAYWDGGPPAKQPSPRGDRSELEYQMRNWYFFTWLSGDHIVEQHIHNLDVCNWLMDAHPAEAQGMGGRQVRTGKEWGQIYDHHFVEFTYADGTKMFSQCRQIPGCWPSQSEHALGVNGLAEINKGAIHVGWESGGAAKPRKKKGGVNAYQIEHDVLFDAVRNDKPYNQVELGASSTMTAILGRMATYCGQPVKWDEAFNSQLSLSPERIAWDAPPRDLPDADGRYPVAMPGLTKSF